MHQLCLLSSFYRLEHPNNYSPGQDFDIRERTDWDKRNNKRNARFKRV